MNSRQPVSGNPAPRRRVVVLVALLAVIAFGVALALRYGGKMTALLDSL